MNLPPYEVFPLDTNITTGPVFGGRSPIVILTVAALLFIGAGSRSGKKAPGDIVDIAAEDGRFTTLVSALEAADLAETLKGEGPFTAFVPTDDAFAKLPEGTVEALLMGIPQLTDILLYHVTPGKVMSSEVVNLRSADTVSSKPIKISLDGDRVLINDTQVVIADIEASNGVIHVIDSVILPPMEMTDIVNIAADDGRFTTMVATVQAAGLVDTLKSEGPFTVFAPTDDAFAELPEGTTDALLNDIPSLTDILLYHVVPSKVMASEVANLKNAETASGKMIKIKVEENAVMINEAKVFVTDIKASNGVIHVIDKVILPPA